MDLMIYGAPSAEVCTHGCSWWVQLQFEGLGGRASLHLHGPNAKEHAEKIAEAINAARRDEVGE